MVLKTALLERAVKEVIELLKEKNRLYGDAFRLTGKFGIAIRILDKAMRQWNLVRQGLNARDEWLDIAGYCFLGLMLLYEEEGKDGRGAHRNL